jgi:hypothetical protein
MIGTDSSTVQSMHVLPVGAGIAKLTFLLVTYPTQEEKGDILGSLLLGQRVVVLYTHSPYTPNPSTNLLNSPFLNPPHLPSNTSTSRPNSPRSPARNSRVNAKLPLSVIIPSTTSLCALLGALLWTRRWTSMFRSWVCRGPCCWSRWMSGREYLPSSRSSQKPFCSVNCGDG